MQGGSERTGEPTETASQPELRSQEIGKYFPYAGSQTSSQRCWGVNQEAIGEFIFFNFKNFIWASQAALVVKNLLANAQDIRDTGLVLESGRYPLEKGMTTHSSILAWRIPWTEEPGGPHSMMGGAREKGSLSTEALLSTEMPSLPMLRSRKI